MNARRFKSFLDIPEEGEPDEETREYLRILDTYRDTFLTFGEENPIHTLDTLYSNPRKAAILMNEGSGSSAETFVYRCRQSSKATLYGENTAGVIDGWA